MSFQWMHISFLVGKLGWGFYVEFYEDDHRDQVEEFSQYNLEVHTCIRPILLVRTGQLCDRRE